MSKYDKLWGFINKQSENSLQLTFDEINNIAKTPIDHSFLNYKKELLSYGWQVGKISMKDKTVRFERLEK